VVAPVSRGLYFADGQMQDEVYNYGSFKQSRMFAAGVTCSDCHDPHSAALKGPVDDLCAQCHTPAKYQTAAHRHHAEVKPALTCASCHMPVRTYMAIDRRHDHGFRIPRPDLSVQLGTPNACNDCHQDKSADWAAEKVSSWFGLQRRGYQTFAGAFEAARTGQADVQALLATLVANPDTPALARASALAELPAPDADLIRRSLADPDPVVRLGALDALEGSPAEQLWAFASSELCPIRSAAFASAPPKFSHPFPQLASRPPIATHSSAPQPSSSLRRS
jgi:predicted CXXCH cytochrome family protein